MKITTTREVARNGRRQHATVRAEGTAGDYRVDELGHGHDRLKATITRGVSGLWFAKLPGEHAQAPYRTLRQAVDGLAFEFASRRLAERIAQHPDVCGQDLRLWRDEDKALAEKGLPDHCILESGHDGLHSVRRKPDVPDLMGALRASLEQARA